MTAPVPQVAVDALRAAENAHIFEPYEGRCRCGFRGRYGEQSQHRDEAVAAAVVAAVQGPIKAEGAREAADEWQRGAGLTVMLPRGVGVPAIDYAQRALDWLRARADRIEAQP
jgi:hypothetical protein